MAAAVRPDPTATPFGTTGAGISVLCSHREDGVRGLRSADRVVLPTRIGNRSITLAQPMTRLRWRPLNIAAAARLVAGQAELDPGLPRVAGRGPVPIACWRMSHLCEVLSAAYQVLGSDSVTQDDRMFRRSCNGPDHRSDQQAGFIACVDRNRCRTRWPASPILTRRSDGHVQHGAPGGECRRRDRAQRRRVETLSATRVQSVRDLGCGERGSGCVCPIRCAPDGPQAVPRT